jgi:arsenate reductase
VKQRVLFVCTGNRARSQMAEALLRFHGPDRFEVHSAGTEPKGLAPETIEVMGEIAIDVSAQRSKHVDEYAGQPFDYVITVCDSARQACPVFPGSGETIHWEVEDPDVPIQAGVPKLDAFRAARDDLQSRVKGFLARTCIFCAILDGDVTGSFIYRDEEIAAFMDIRPITEGHALIVPVKHHVTMDEVPEAIAGRMMELSGRVAMALGNSVRMAGYDLFVANGEEAGQEVFHVHLHVIPRYRGDGFGFKFPDGYGRIEDRNKLDELAGRLRDHLSQA